MLWMLWFNEMMSPLTTQKWKLGSSLFSSIYSKRASVLPHFSCVSKTSLLQHLNSELWLAALPGYSYELPIDLPSSAGSTGVTEQHCEVPCWTEMQYDVVHIQKAKNCNICLHSPVAAVHRCWFLLDPAVVHYILSSGRRDMHIMVLS